MELQCICGTDTQGDTVTYKTVDMFLTCGVFDEYLHVEKSY